MLKIFSPLVFILTMCGGSTLKAQTIIADNTEVNGTWTLDNSPYIIEGRAIVPNNQNLIIEPGVEVRLHSSSSQTPSWFDYEEGNVGVLRVQGAITAIGTEENPIVFTRHENGFWGCVLIDPINNTVSELSHCIIEYAKESRNVTGIDSPVALRGGLSVIGTSTIINHNLFRLNNLDGLYLRETNPVWQFEYNTFTENGANGVNIENGAAHGANNRFVNNSVSSSGQVAAVKLSNSVVYIVSSLIYNNDDIAISASNGGSYYLINNTVYGNSQGIRAETDADVFIYNSIFFENEINFATSNAGSGDLELHYSLTDDLEVAVNVDALGNNLFDGNPQFTDALALDFSLQNTSPCIDGGDPSTNGLGIPTFDILGNERIDNSIIDMGPIEFQQPVSIAKSEKPVVAVFPNPADDFVNIDCDGFRSATVVNAAGKQVGVSFTPYVDLTSLPSGIYYLSIDFENSLPVVQKVIRK